MSKTDRLHTELTREREKTKRLNRTIDSLVAIVVRAPIHDQAKVAVFEMVANAREEVKP